MSKHIKKALKVAIVVFAFHSVLTLGKFAQAFTAAKTAFATTLVGSLTSKGVEAVNGNFGTKFTTRTPTAPRQIIYGQTRVGGVLAHIETTGTDNVILHQVIVIAGHEIESLVKVKFGDTDLALDSGSTVNGSTVYKVTNSKYKNTENENKIDSNGTLVQLTFEDGSQTAANGFLTNQLSSMTSDHKFKDCAYVYIKMVHDSEKFAGGIPAISFEVKGKKVYDPRNGQTAWSDNPALCIRDYLSDTTYGLKATSSELNDTTNAGGFNSAATTCEQQVADIDGTNRNRYTANGFTNFSASGEGILEGLLSAMAGRLTYVNGKFNVFAGATQTPSLTIVDDDLLSDITVATNPNSANLYNTVKPVYIDASTNYTASDAPIFQSSTFLNADTPSGESTANYVKQLELRMPFTTNVSEAQRIARIKLNEQRQTQTLDVLVSLKFMQLQPNDWVYLTNERLSYSSKVFEVVSTQLEIVQDDEVPIVATRLVLKETANSVYSFVSNDYETEISEGSSVSTGTFTLSSPTSLSLASVVSVDITTTKINIQASWTNATNNAILGTEIRYGTSSGTYTGSVLVGKGETNAVITNLNSNTTYYVVARHFSANNIFSSYTAEQSVATGASTTAPNVPTSLAATTGNPLSVKVSWTNPSNSDLRAVKIYRHTAAITPTNDTYLVNTIAVEPGTSTSVIFGKQDGLTADTTYYFYARAINHTGLHSSFTSGVTGNFTEVEVTDIDLPDFSGYFHKEGSTTTALTDSQFNTAYGRTPLADDILIMVNTSASPKVSKAYKYTSGSFVEISNFTTGDLVVDGTLAGSKIIAASIAADRVDSSFISTLNLITTSATIGNDITIGSGNSVFKADSNGIYLGNSTFASAPFRVTPAGALTASSAVLSGSIKTGEAITAGTGTRTVKVSGSTNTDIILSAGNATPSLAPFKVKSDGSIEITNLKLFKSDGTTKMFDSATGFTDDAFSEIATDLGTAISTYAVNKTGSSASDAQKITLTASQSITVTATKPAFMSGSNNLSGTSGANDANAQIPAKVTMVLKHSTNADLSSATTLAYLGSSATDGVTKLFSVTGTASATQYRVTFFSESEAGFAFTEANTVTNEGAVNSDYKFSISDTATYAAGDHYFFVVIGGTAGTVTTGANNVSDSSAARGMAFSGTEFYIASDGDASDTGEGDITAVTAGTGLSGGGTSGAVTLSLTTPALPLAGGTLTGTLTTTASAPHFITPAMLRMDHYESAWGANASRTYIQKGWSSGTGDYFQLTATGNQSNTSSSSVSMTDSLGILFGRGKDTFDGTMSTEWARIDTSGNFSIPGKITLGTDPGGDAFNTNSPLMIGSNTHAYINIKAGASHAGGLLIGDSSDDFVGGLIYNNATNELALNSGNSQRLQISSTGAITFNQAYTFPTADGSSGQMLVTDGAGNLSFGTAGATPLDNIRSLGSPAFTGTATTAGMMSEIESDGGFDSYTSVFKTTWSYAGNFDLSDAGRFTETAGTSFITWTDNSSDTTRGNITVLAIAPNSGGSIGKQFVYVDQGSSYNPGWREIWGSMSDGSGSGLDADTLDGVHASSFISNSASGQVSNIYIRNTSPTLYLRDTDHISSMVHQNSNVFHVLRADAADDASWSTYDSTTASGWPLMINLTDSAPYVKFGPSDVRAMNNTMWHAGNDGSGSGLDADLVDGIEGASFLRGDVDDTFSNKLVSSARNKGIFGTYSSYATDQIWSMGAAYMNASDGSNFGNLYGLAYKHTNNTTGGTMGGGHQMVWCVNGSPQGAIGDHQIWHHAAFKVGSSNHIVWHAGNDGAGSGLDADTLDGISSASFLRSDAADTMSASLSIAMGYTSDTAGHLYLHQTTNGEGATIKFSDQTSGGQFGLFTYKHTNTQSNGLGDSFHFNSNQTSTAVILDVTGGNSNYFVGTNKVWHAGNDGGGSGLDADTLDGLQFSSFIRSDTNDSFSGTLTFNAQVALVAGNYGEGLFGLYSATRYQHVWSMGAAYKTNASGTSYGNMYGLTYTHTNIGTGTNQSISGLSHQLQHRRNGTLTAAIGNGIWTAYNVTAYSDIAVKRNLEIIPNALEKVCSINGYTYERTDYIKDDEDANADDVYRQAGVVAQEIEKVLPEVVSGEEGNKAVAYGNVVALLIEAIKELKSEVEDLKEQLEV